MKFFAVPKIGFTQLPHREEEICLRVRQVREHLRYKQKDFAQALGISRERLASYEYVRAPVKYWFAARLAERFGVNQRWLATGEEPSSPNLVLASDFISSLEDSQLFSRAYDERLRALFDQYFNRSTYLFSLSDKKGGPDAAQKRLNTIALLNEVPLGTPHYKAVAMGAVKSVEPFLSTLPPKLLVDFFDKASVALMELIERLKKEHPHEVAEFRKALQDAGLAGELPSKSFSLTPSALSITKPLSMADILNLKPLSAWERFRNQLRELTSAPGQKAALARKIGVTSGAVTQWLSDKENVKAMPSATTLLQLQEWVCEAEAQQKKRAGSGDTQPALKTRNQKSKVNEIPKSNRPEK